MTDRKTESMKRGSFSEKAFASHMLRIDADFYSEVGTDADKKLKRDFIVDSKRVQVKAPTGKGRTPGLCCEFRAVNGSTGFLLLNDFVVKFIDSTTYKRYHCPDLIWYIRQVYGEPGPLLRQQNGAPHHVWYARKDWTDEKGIFHPRENEACIMLPFEEIERFCVRTIKIKQ